MWSMMKKRSQGRPGEYSFTISNKFFVYRWIRDNDDTIEMMAVEDISNTIRNDLNRLYSIWKEMGLCESTRSLYCKEVHKHIKELMSEMIFELEEKKNALLEGVQALMKLAATLAKELDMDDTPGTNPDYEQLPLIEVQKNLRAQVAELQMIKNRRLEYFNELQARDEVVCKKLGTKPLCLNKEIPSEVDLARFNDYLEVQEREKVRLDTMFKDLRMSIMKLMNELNMSPSLDFERLVCNDYENFVYTADNMSKLTDMRNDLKAQVVDAKQQAAEKREELKALWNYLDEPEYLCEAFLRKHPGYSVTTINALNTEIKRCKDKRSENIGKYVAKVRDELESLWNLCMFSESQKRSFMPFYSQTYTEDLLTLHELEAEKLKKFYSTNKRIFDLLQEREVLWEKMKELDQRANDPDRFHNRGGQLLAEEKERKNTTKKLPKIEEQLLQATQDYGNAHGDAFTINGVPVIDFLDFSKAEYEREKENLKIVRKQAKDKSEKKTPLSTSKRTPIGISIRVRTPGGTAAKRKLPYDSSPNNTVTKRRIMSGEKNRTAVISSKARRSGRASKKALMNPNKSNTPKSGKRQIKKAGDSKVNLSVTSYGQFQEHLVEREELRSSMISEQLFENARDRANMKTPVRTPAKPLRKNLLSLNTPRGTPKSASTSRSALRSPKVLKTPRLATAPNSTHLIF